MPAVAFLSGAWKFISSPFGLVLILALGVFMYGGYKKRQGYAECKTEWVAANAAADLAKKDLEAKVARTVRELAQKAEADLEKQKTKFEEILGEYEVELAKRPNNACLLNDADIRRLRPAR